MALLDKLKSLLNIDLSGLRKSKITINILSNNKISSKKTEQTINIGLQALDPEKTRQLVGIVREAVSDDGYLAIEAEANKLLTDFEESDSRKENKEILEYFRNKIPPQDLVAFRASLYLKRVYEEHGSSPTVQRLKSDIVLRYGVRGKNIANLCTAGYFESVVRPLYEELSSREGFTSDQFLARYDVIVMQYPFAVFVSRSTSVEGLIGEIAEKIKRNKKYGIGRLNIHAIGGENIDKIERVLGEKSIKKVFTDRPQTDSGKGYMIITIFY